VINLTIPNFIASVKVTVWEAVLVEARVLAVVSDQLVEAVIYPELTYPDKTYPPPPSAIVLVYEVN